jgi:hypothetical protein
MSGIFDATAVASGLPLSPLRVREGMAGAGSVGVCRVWVPDLSDCRNDLPGHADSVAVWFRAMWWVTTQKNGASALGLQRVLGLKSYETAWTWLHKLRRAMVRPGRDLLTGRVEVDECYVGGLEEGLPGRLNLQKAPDCGCRSRGWTGDWADSHASDCGRFSRKLGALCAGLGRSG